MRDGTRMPSITLELTHTASVCVVQNFLSFELFTDLVGILIFGGSGFAVTFIRGQLCDTSFGDSSRARRTFDFGSSCGLESGFPPSSLVSTWYWLHCLHWHWPWRVSKAKIIPTDIPYMLNNIKHLKLPQKAVDLYLDSWRPKTRLVSHTLLSSFINWGKLWKLLVGARTSWPSYKVFGLPGQWIQLWNRANLTWIKDRGWSPYVFLLPLLVVVFNWFNADYGDAALNSHRYDT